MVQLIKCGHYATRMNDLKSIIRKFAIDHKDMFTENDCITIIIPAMKALNIPENVIEVFQPASPKIDSNNLEKYIFVQVGLKGKNLTEEDILEIVEKLKEVSLVKLPNVIRTLISMGIDNHQIWN